MAEPPADRAPVETNMNRAEIVFPGLLVLLVGGLLAGGIFVAGYSWKVVAFPFAAGAIMCGLCILLVATTLMRGTLQAARGPEPPSETMTEALTWSSIGWVFVLGLFLYGLGFVLGPAAYLIVYLRRNGVSWPASLAIGGGSILVTWGLFIRLLRVLLPLQPLWLG
jgi:hypothetical protein